MVRMVGRLPPSDLLDPGDPAPTTCTKGGLPKKRTCGLLAPIVRRRPAKAGNGSASNAVTWARRGPSFGFIRSGADLSEARGASGGRSRRGRPELRRADRSKAGRRKSR